MKKAIRFGATLFCTARKILCELYYRGLIDDISRSSRIECGVEIRNPGKLSVGPKSLIKRGTIINARSEINGHGVVLCQDVYIKEYCYIDSYDGYIRIIGPAAIGQFCTMAGQGGISIGRYVMIGPGTRVFTSNHNHSSLGIPYMCQGSTARPVDIEDNVWIGANCVILGGVRIGKNSIIGAGTVVTKDVPPNSIFVNLLKPHIIETKG